MYKRQGLGISAVPRLALFHFRVPEIVTRPLGWAGLKRQIYLVRRRDRGLSVAAQEFYQWAMARRPAAPVPSASRKAGKAARPR